MARSRRVIGLWLSYCCSYDLRYDYDRNNAFFLTLACVFLNVFIICILKWIMFIRWWIQISLFSAFKHGWKCYLKRIIVSSKFRKKVFTIFVNNRIRLKIEHIFEVDSKNLLVEKFINFFVAAGEDKFMLFIAYELNIYKFAFQLRYFLLTK